MNLIYNTILTISFILIAVTAKAGALQDEILKVIPSYVGIRETLGENKGPEVNKILKNVGLPPGSPWCMSLVYTINDDAASKLNIQNKLPKTGSSAAYWRYANKHKLTFKVTPAKQVMLGASISPASTGIFKTGPYRGDGTFSGHANINIRQINKKSYYALDGNTTDKRSKGQEWEGGCSAYKTRYLGISNFLLLGFIEVRD